MPNLEDIVFTEHSIERFKERTRKLFGYEPEDPEKILRGLLNRSMPDEIKPMHRVIRLMNNGYKDATFRHSQGWRFVIIDNRVCTVERRDPDQN